MWRPRAAPRREVQCGVWGQVKEPGVRSSVRWGGRGGGSPIKTEGRTNDKYMTPESVQTVSTNCVYLLWFCQRNLHLSSGVIRSYSSQQQRTLWHWDMNLLAVHLNWLMTVKRIRGGVVPNRRNVHLSKVEQCYLSACMVQGNRKKCRKHDFELQKSCPTHQENSRTFTATRSFHRGAGLLLMCHETSQEIAESPQYCFCPHS